MTAQLHWEQSGPADGAPLVLLSSIGADLHMWDPVVGALAETFRVVAVDARGHGRSAPQHSTRTPDIADLGRDVLAVLDEAGIARAHVAGISLGGMTALWLAAHHPDRIGRLALICTSARPASGQPFRDRAATVRTQGIAAVADAVVSRWVTPALADRDLRLVARLRAMMVATDVQDYAWCCEAIAALDLLADLPRIAAPTLVVSADQDQALPPEHGRRIADGIAGSSFHVLPGAAHIPTVEQAGRLVTLLRDHLGPADLRERGTAVRRAVLGDAHVDRAAAAATDFGAPFQDFITRYAWGEIWGDDTLTRRERSIATLVALVAVGAENELPLHVRGALRNGLTEQEIGAVLLHCAIYAGVPRANSAFAVARAVLAEDR